MTAPARVLVEKFGKRRWCRYQAWPTLDAVWRPGDPVLWVDRGEDMYALMADQYRGRVVAVVRPSDWRNGIDVDPPPEVAT